MTSAPHLIPKTGILASLSIWRGVGESLRCLSRLPITNIAACVVEISRFGISILFNFREKQATRGGVIILHLGGEDGGAWEV